MAVPFHRVRVSGDVVLAARGGAVHTFNATTGAHISVWRLPHADVSKKQGGGSGKADSHGSAKKLVVEAAAATAAPSPPAKRRKLEEGAENNNAARLKPKPKPAPLAAVTAALRSADLPMVSILEVSADGRHVIVVMGQGKTVRVLAHDQKGGLEQISQRVVPKRPCGVALTADGKTILSADKFGDVYALPLIEEGTMTPSPAAAEVAEAATEATKEVAVDSTSPAPAATPAPAAPPLQLQANRFTVHTKGNLQALENQRRQKELQQQRKDQLKQQQQQPAVSESCRLLLGHVSMLTAVAIAEAVAPPSGSSDGVPRPRPLIITADRDEHIRVTRGVLGQTHVIETFCLGHTSFVSRLCVVPGVGAAGSARPRLISGGGDGELVLWDFWPEGRALGRAALGPLAGELVLPFTPVGESVAPLSDGAGAETKTNNLAVAGLYTCVLPARTGDTPVPYIVAILERVPALFVFRLAADGNNLLHVQTLRLPGDRLPLDVGVLAGAGSSQHDAVRLVVATMAGRDESEAGASSSLLVLVNSHDAATSEYIWTVQKDFGFESVATLGRTGWNTADSVGMDVDSEAKSQTETDADADGLDPVALRQVLLYSIESLRKDNEEGGMDD